MNFGNLALIRNVKSFLNIHGAGMCVGLGIAGAVGAGVLGARGWYKTKVELEKKSKELEDLQKAKETGKIVVNGEEHPYTESDYKKDAHLVKTSSFKIACKNMWLSAVIAVTSGVLIFGGYKHVSGQLSAALSAVSIMQNKNTVLDGIIRREFGDEKANMLISGYKMETKETVTENPETGEQIVTLEEQMVKAFDVPNDGIFRFTYGRGCKGWTPGRRDIGLKQLDMVSSWATNKLCAKHRLSVLDIYDAIGLDNDRRSAAAQICGWCEDTNHPGELKVKLMADPYDDPQSDEIHVILNTQGVILDRMKKINEHLLSM